MLVLTRKLTEKLYIGSNICVTVVRLDSGQVRLGIEAPREISVMRAELVPRAHPQAEAVARPQGDRPLAGELRSLPRLVHGIDSRRRAPSQ
jgi:carbon storage regulator